MALDRSIANAIGWFNPRPTKSAATPGVAPPIVVLPDGQIPQPGQVSVPSEGEIPTGPASAPPPAPPPGGGGGNAATPPAGAKAPDWVSMFWGSLGLDASTIAGLTKTLTGVTDAAQAQLLGQNYLRQSSWYQQTFPGFDLGVRAGLFTDETGYRSYVNALTQSSQQYLGRAVTTAEVTQALQAGVDPALYANRLQGNALAQTLGPQAQYEAGAFTSEGRLSSGELQAYGQEKAGIDTPLGQAITQRLQQAQQRMQGLFSGTLATPNLSLGPQGLFAPSLQGNKGVPDTGA